MHQHSTDPLQVCRRSLFATRELTIRTGAQVRSFSLTRRRQIVGAGLALVVAAIAALPLTAVVLYKQDAQWTQEEMLAREAQVASEAARVAAYREDLSAAAVDLQRRQAFLEEMVAMLPEDIVEEDQTAAEPQPKGTAAQLSAVLPEAAALARTEQRQLQLVGRLTRFAQARAAGAEAAIRKLGLDPRAVVASGRVGQGGPLERLDTGGDAALDRHFQKLGLSLARMDELESALARIPQVMPADIAMISSGFGVRRDPFTGEAATHSGLDFRGAVGAPIHAAATGRVSFAGVKGGYGKVLEISHGNGLMTRYAHMSGFRARVGQEVAAGDVIGLIGNTGRSTGPHLHFEVRVYGRAVNPRPFLENAPELLQQVRASDH